jgi:hypothetical protein
MRRASVVATLTVALVLGASSAAPAKSDHRATPAGSPIPGGFCGYWGPNYSYRLPDGTIIRCG